jgi:GTP-binding protein EngB required for normal cell division
MGSENSSEKKAFEMNIQLIGENLTNFKNSLSNAKNKNSIQNSWKFFYDKDLDVYNQINKYFDKLLQFKKGKDKTICLKECLLVRIKNIFDPETNLIIEKVNSLGQIQYMPIVLFLLENNFSTNIKLSIDEKKYKRVEPRLIIVTKFDEENPNNIEPLLLRFCSIHNELGDRFTVGEGNDAEDYDLINNYFPFNINIACIGRFGQGKSTGVNVILNEYKAKESAKGSSQTKQLTFYQVLNQPIRLLDIPGFEDTETVKKAIEKFQQCGEKINKIKDNLHIILYFLNYGEQRAFANLELPILEEVCNHKTSKIIYVITHSNPNMDDQDKEDKIDNINEGLQNITINSKIHNETIDKGMLVASADNVVFVNFHRDNKNGFEPFGIQELFQKIYIYFIKSEDYINSNEKLDDQNVKKQAERLRAQAKEMLLSNKVWGGVVGIIPGVDWLLQKFVIKKNAAKKLGQIYGIDVKFIDDKGNNINVNKYKPEYITASVDTEHLNMEMKGEELIQESTAYTVGNTFKVTGEAASYIGGGAAVGTGIIRAASTIAETSSATTTAATTAAVGIGSTALKAVGTGLFVVGAVVGVALGGYFTTKYCDDLINKFEDYYIKNAQIIGNSYKQAAEYLLSQYSILDSIN